MYYEHVYLHTTLVTVYILCGLGMLCALIDPAINCEFFPEIDSCLTDIRKRRRPRLIPTKQYDMSHVRRGKYPRLIDEATIRAE